MTISPDVHRAVTPPRDGLRRESPFALRSDTERGEDGLTLDGYAAVFNRQTIIDSWEGRFKEEIAPGAMKKSFRENPPRIQFDHGHHPLIGSIPIAAAEPGYPREEVDPALAPEGGAHIVARLHDNWLVQPVRDAIASRSIDGMSFRFGVVREEWRDADGKKVTDEQTLRDLLRRSWMEEVPDEELLVRTLKELRVPELGPVVWPAYTNTSVDVRSQTLVIDLSRLNEPEQQHKLATAVLMADRAEGDDSPPLTHADVDHDAAPAEGHDAEVRDTPQITDIGSAETHESVSSQMRLKDEIRARMRLADHSLHDAAKAESRFPS